MGAISLREVSVPYSHFAVNLKVPLKIKLISSWANTLIRKVNQFQGGLGSFSMNLIRLNLENL